MGELCRQVALGELDDLSKGGHVGYGDVRKDLPVQLYTGPLEAVHQLAVREAAQFGGRTDTNNPKTPELTPPHSPISIGKSKGSLHGLSGRTIKPPSPPHVALGEL